MKHTFFTLTLFLLALLSTSCGNKKVAYQNPLPMAFGDPFLLKASDGKYYMYGTGGVSNGFKVYSSDDLVTWTDEGPIYQGGTSDSWATDCFWAPEVYERDGKYYLWFSANWKENPTKEQENFRIGVAVADKPTGPFKELFNQPVFDPGYPIIDANILFDDASGKTYLYYSRCCYKHAVDSEVSTWAKEKGWFDEIEESWIYGVELKPDFSGIIGEPVALLCPPQTMDDPQAEWENRSVTSHEVNRRWTEGSYIVKHKNLYYMLYSANFFGGKNYAVGYATSQNPLGPFTKAANNPVLQKDTEQGGIVTGTGHCMLIDIHNRLYCVYHGRTETTGDERMVFIDPIDIQPDGKLVAHQRAVTSDKRVFILTRSAFAGQQRYGANTWTGDITASWEVLEKQIPAGLNFSLCGIPHWNSDIGGFFLWQYPLMLDDPDYRELYARWIQFGTFCPMMRSHGEGAPREIYQFGKKGEPIYDAIEKYIRLRYSLLPYIYTTAWEVTANQSSFMRALAMDFAHDRNVWNIHNQYMFGKSLLVCPVTQPMYTQTVSDTIRVEDFSTVKSMRIYLPKNTEWYDFWTNQKHSGGQYIVKDTPIDILPLYVKAGSILPIGPEVQYSTEKSWDNLEIKVYPGCNGEFTLYEDENDNYNYEKGMYSTITMKWNDRTRMLTIENRKGEFSGMLKERKFNIVTADGAKKAVAYNGKKVTVKM